MLIFLAAASTLFLAVHASPSDGINAISTNWIGNAFCKTSWGEQSSAAISPYGCMCVDDVALSIADKWIICEGDLGACLVTTTVTTGSVQTTSIPTNCTICADEATCLYSPSIYVAYPGFCQEGSEVYSTLGGVSCACAPTGQIPAEGVACIAPENSYATCGGSVYAITGGPMNTSACGFTCLDGFETTEDGTGCVATA